MPTLTRPLNGSTKAEDLPSLVLAAEVAANRLGEVADRLQAVPFCDDHGDPYADGSCVEHDVEARTVVTMSASASHVACARLRRSARGLPSGALLGDIQRLEVARQELARIRPRLTGHEVDDLLVLAASELDELTGLLEIAAHA